MLACLFPKCDCKRQCYRGGYMRTPSAPQAEPPVSTLEQWNGALCPYCAKVMHTEHMHMKPSRDHIVPRGRGGPNTSANLTIACTRCNHNKGDKTLLEWQFELALKNDPRMAHVAAFLQAHEAKQTATAFEKMLALENA